MNTSKRFYISRAMQNKDVLKTLEAIILTNPSTQAREFAVKAFEIEFSKEISNIFHDYLLNEEDIELNIVMSFDAKEELMKFCGATWQVENLLLKPDMLNFEMMYCGEPLMTIKHFDTLNKTIVFETEMYISNDKKRNEAVFNIIKLFEKLVN